MSQKDYKMLIILALLRRENHIRGLAKEIDTNQTTIARKIGELYKENVVDYTLQGKNKAFFLKRTLEAKHNVFIAEQYKMLQLIGIYPHLKDTILQIQKNKNVHLAVLFGSYAKLTAKKQSDIDLYLETADRNIKKEVGLLNSKLSVKIGIFDRDSLLIKEIEKNHVIIKGAEAYYEKNKFFG